MLKDRLEQERITKIREEIELVMCTYYGKGRVSRDRLIDFVETLKVIKLNYIIQRRELKNTHTELEPMENK